MTQLRTIDFMNHLCDQHPLGGGLWIYSKSKYQKLFEIGLDSKSDLLTFFGEYYRTCCLRPVEGKVSVEGKDLLFNGEKVDIIKNPQTWKDYVNREKREELVSFRVMSTEDDELEDQDSVINAARFLKSLLHVLLDCESTNKGIGFLNRFTTEQVLEPFRRMLDWDEVDFISIAKYISCWPLAASRYVLPGQELPPVPKLFSGEDYDDSPVLWRGAIKKFLMNRILCRAKGTKNLTFLYSWQQAKRGCETVSEAFEAEAVKKHQKSLKTPFVEVALDPESNVWTLEKRKSYLLEGEEVKEIKHSLVEKECVGDDAQEAVLAIVDLLVPYQDKPLDFQELEASQSACFETMRSEGGQRAVVRRIAEADSFNDYLAQMIFCPRSGVKELRTDLWCGWNQVLHLMRSSNRHSEFGVAWDRRVEERYNHMFAKDESFDGYINRIFSELWEVGSEDDIVSPYGERKYRDTMVSWEKVRGEWELSEDDAQLFSPEFWESVMKEERKPWNRPIFDKEKARAQVATVKEPLKVRTLTKEEAVPQYLCRVLQKKLWSALRDRKPFRLIGEPVSEDIINDVLMTGSPFDMVVSGDYSAATDGLNPRLSGLILERCLRNLRVPTDLSDAARAILGMHCLSYGHRLEELTGLKSFDQVRGQLMGGILSFPILCILNFMTYLVSVDMGRQFLGECMRDWNRYSENSSRSRWVRENLEKLDGLKVLINGDDILYPSSEEEYRRWNHNLAHFGFTKSLGKNLISKRFCTVNSEIFSIRAPETFVKEHHYKYFSRLGGEVLFSEEKPVPYKVQRCGYLNLGLLEARSKVNQSGADGSPLWDLFNKMIKDCGNKNLARKFFLTYNEKEISEMTNRGKFNLFLPRSLGGCGFEGEAEFYTEFQLRLASYLYRRHRRAGEVMTEDLGLVNKTVKSCSIAIDTQEGMVGKRVRNFDVPENGWVVKKPKITASAVFGGAEGEKEMKRRMPYDISPEELQKKPVSIKKLLSFTDCLKIVLQVPRM